MTIAAATATHGRLDRDDHQLAGRFRSLDPARRRRLACAMVRRALSELPIALPPHVVGLLGTSGIATPAQLADLDRRAASSGGAMADADLRRARIIAAARYALSPQPRAPEEAVYEALHSRASLPGAMHELRRELEGPR